ncbi:MAG: ASPIC/UnbV domain-containing protein [Planctomycetes bacterium]|nr:ASPIC/UnbV domain-containing protein [Planctomycetota bacterium]
MGGGRTQIRDALLSTTSAFPLTACFGLGEAALVDVLEVRWPTGRVERVAVTEVDRVILVEAAGDKVCE